MAPGEGDTELLISMYLGEQWIGSARRSSKEAQTQNTRQARGWPLANFSAVWSCKKLCFAWVVLVSQVTSRLLLLETSKSS